MISLSDMYNIIKNKKVVYDINTLEVVVVYKEVKLEDINTMYIAHSNQYKTIDIENYFILLNKDKNE